MSEANDRLPRALTLPMVFCVALKQVIGGGVVVLTGTAVAMTGAGAAVAYGLACVEVLLVSLPYAVLGAAVPVSGSLYRWPARFLGPVPGFMGFWMVLGTHVGLAAYAATFGLTVHALLPSVPARVAGPGAIGFVLVLNLLGGEASARVGIAVTVATAAALLGLAAAGLPAVSAVRLGTVLPHGWGALLGAAALLTFPIGGATLVSELAGEMRRPGRDLPVAILGATAAAAGLYVLVALVAAGLAPPASGGVRSLEGVAALVMGPVALTLFGLGTGVVSMLGIMNAHMLWGSRSVLMVCRDGWFPVALGQVNRFGAPTGPLVLLAVIGAVPVVAGLGVADVIRVSALGATGSAVLSVVCAAVYARREPAGYAASALAIPVRALWAAVGAAVAAQGVTLLVLLRDLPVGLTLAWVGWFAVGLAVAFARRPVRL